MRMDELLQKLKERDLAAYNYVYETYGWELHNYLQDKCPDKEQSAEVFRLAMNNFCDDLAGRSEADLLDLILRTYADRALQEVTKAADLSDHLQLHQPDFRRSDDGQMELSKNPAPALEPKKAEIPEIFPDDGSMTPSGQDAPANADLSWEEDMLEEDLSEEGRSRSVIGRVLLIFLLVVAVVVIAWAVLGIAVKMGWISNLRFNLGHAWFNQNIAPWF